MAKVLFILKARDNAFECDNEYTYSNGMLSSGLCNSATFVCNMLRDVLYHDSKIVHVVDNNAIDREVTAFRPDVVVIEAFWVVPEKFEVLSRLHPTVTWLVRNHSAVPFAATEGIIMDWSLRYMDKVNVVLSCNDDRTDDEFRDITRAYKRGWSETDLNGRVVWLPNYYPVPDEIPWRQRALNTFVDIACFGAVRPLKNHLIQAVSAIRYAEQWGKRLRFHVNGTRVEGKGEPVLNNLRKMFALMPHELVEHNWMPHDEFKALLDSMDLSMQVSFTETFNIVTADAVTMGVPVLVSPDIRWVHSHFMANCNNSVDITKSIQRVLSTHNTFGDSWRPSLGRLIDYNNKSVAAWGDFLNGVDAGLRPAAP